MADIRHFIAKNVALMLGDGDLVNLGSGIPNLVVEHMPQGKTILVHSENGVIGAGPLAKDDEIDETILDSSTAYSTLLPWAACFDSALSFGIARGGHLDCTILGALQVDAEGNLANWDIPGKYCFGVGGAVDLTQGAKRVIVAMEHTTKKGEPKILERCVYPLTCRGKVKAIVTELCILDVAPEGLVLRSLAPGVDPGQVQAKTAARVIVPAKVDTMASC